MTALIVDAGNTSVKMVRWEGSPVVPDFAKGGFVLGQAEDSPVELGSVPTLLSAQDPHEFSNRLSGLAAGAQDQIVLVSVVPAVENMVRKIWPSLKVVGLHAGLPFSHEIREPATVGPDRFCNIAWALASGLTSALVVDVGTATTFDLLVDGVFKGGLIAPGMEFAAKEMASHGAMLSEYPFEIRPAKIGQDTREAMMGGAWLTGSGGVEWTIARLLETYGPVPVILTGGLSGLLPLENRYHDPHWTLRGASYLSEAK